MIEPISNLMALAKKLQEMNGVVVNSVNVIATINAIKSIVNSFSSTLQPHFLETLVQMLKQL